MRGNHLFGIFSPEKLKKGDSPAPGPGSREEHREEPRCGESPCQRKAQKGDSPAGFQGSGRSPDAGITFSAFSARTGLRAEPRCGGITFSAFSARTGVWAEPRCAGITFSAFSAPAPGSRGPGRSPDVVELFRACRKGDSPASGLLPGPAGARCGGITFLSSSGLRMPKR